MSTSKITVVREWFQVERKTKSKVFSPIVIKFKLQCIAEGLRDELNENHRSRKYARVAHHVETKAILE